MAHKHYEVYRCDRCGHQVSIAANQSIEAGWGKLVASAQNMAINAGRGGGRYDSDYQGVDLCPACVEFLRAWWETGESGDPEKPRLIEGAS